MAATQNILKKLKALKENAAIPGVLPLAAYYRREPEVEAARGAMYKAVSEVCRMTDEQFEEAFERMENQHERVVRTGPSYRLIDMTDSLTVINNMAGPLEYLVSRGEMETADDEDGMGGARFHTALRVRDLFDGAQVKGLRSPSLSGAGGGGARADITAYQVDCMKLLQRLRIGMEATWAYPLLESVLWRDEWVNLGPAKGSGQARVKTITALHYALDVAGVVLGYTPQEDVNQRWPDGAPGLPPQARNHTQASTAAAQLGLLTSRGVRQA